MCYARMSLSLLLETSCLFVRQFYGWTFVQYNFLYLEGGTIKLDTAFEILFVIF